MRRLEVEISSLEDAGKQFVDICYEAESGGSKKRDAREIISFPDVKTLFKVLTPVRLDLLKALKGCGPTSVRKLAAELQRDYSNVHGDVKTLEFAGFIERAGKEICVPWDEVDAHFSLISSEAVHAKADREMHVSSSSQQDEQADKKKRTKNSND